MSKPNSKGMLPNGRKSPGPPFVRALYAIFDHPDYLALAKQSRAFLWDLARQYNGFNNGNLSAAPGTMARLGWTKDEIKRAVKELKALGWIEITREQRYGRQPHLYRLAWLNTDRWEGAPHLDRDALQQKVKSLR